MRPIPGTDPLTGKPLQITELSTTDGEITIRGIFAVPRFSALDQEQTHFLETFLKCRGMIAGVEKELGISYPTARARLDSLLSALNLTPVREQRRISAPEKTQILDLLERGEITAEEAKARMNGVHAGHEETN
ncbi:MAG: DUF2089 domain-containing protein [Armatimonadetes bacterium]|nr:DUF2089 domain-containing protein [Armatimonadota bacterium]